MNDVDRKIFDAALSALERSYRRRMAERDSASNQAEADICSRRMQVIADAIDGVRELRAENLMGPGDAG